jgi:hypothetical protein
MNSNQDVDHLRLLSIFHFVVAGMLALFSMFPLVHVALGVVIVSGAFDNVDSGEAPPAIFGWLFIIFPMIFIVCGLAFSTCVAISGRRLGRHTNHTFCLVMAAMECMAFPFGTVLGVFTIIVLMRPTVKELFGVA